MLQTNQMQWSTVKEMTKIYPSFSEASLRWLIFNSQKNGFNICLRKLGRKVLINLKSFEYWVESHGATKTNGGV